MRQDVFGVAYQEARSDLQEISRRCEQLRKRKEHLEGVLAAFGPLLGVIPPVRAQIEQMPAPAPASQASPQPPPAPETITYTFNQVAAPLPEQEGVSSDPFQRRIRNALKGGPLSRDHDGMPHAV